jgi:putative aldouronate transport system substrate-binding protein
MVPVELDADWGSTFFENQLGVPMYYPTDLPVFKTGDGKIRYIAEHPNYKTYLQTMNQMDQKGYITADNYAVKNASETQAVVAANKAFAYAWCSDSTVQLNAVGQKADPSISWVMVNPTLGGDKVHLITSGTGWSGTFISKKNKHPDVAIKFMQFMSSLEGQRLSEWGREGIEWTMGSNGLPKFNDDWLASSKDDKIMYTKYTPAFIFGITPVVEAEGRALNDTDAIRAYNAKVRAVVEIQPELNLSLPKADSDASVILSKLEAMRRSQEVKCILSKTDAEFETNYADLIKQTGTIGVAALDDALNTNLANLPK